MLGIRSKLTLSCSINLVKAMRVNGILSLFLPAVKFICTIIIFELMIELSLLQLMSRCKLNLTIIIWCDPPHLIFEGKIVCCTIAESFSIQSSKTIPLEWNWTVKYYTYCKTQIFDNFWQMNLHVTSNLR